ncbi:unnamed protein product, partial [Hapterophycus canaliculatus]
RGKSFVLRRALSPKCGAVYASRRDTRAAAGSFGWAPADEGGQREREGGHFHTEFRDALLGSAARVNRSPSECLLRQEQEGQCLSWRSRPIASPRVSHKNKNNRCTDTSTIQSLVAFLPTRFPLLAAAVIRLLVFEEGAQGTKGFQQAV